MYSASVSTYPDSSSSRIFLQELKTKTDPGRPGRYSLAALNAANIQSKEPSFTSRQTIIRLHGGVRQIKLGKSNEAAGFNGKTAKTQLSALLAKVFTPDDDEWSEMLLPWTVRAFNDDGRFNTVNKEDDKPKYSQRYRIRENGNNGKRDLGDIVNSPIVAVGGYLATSANDGMVHIFKQSGGDKRGYNLKLSYIPVRCRARILKTTTPPLPKSCAPLPKKAMWATATAWTAALFCAKLTTKIGKTACLCSARWALAAEARMPWI